MNATVLAVVASSFTVAIAAAYLERWDSRRRPRIVIVRTPQRATKMLDQVKITPTGIVTPHGVDLNLVDRPIGWNLSVVLAYLEAVERL